MKNIIVIDNFYENPLSVRDLALKCEYIDQENLPDKFAGTESKKSFYTKDVLQKIETAIGQKIIVDPKNYSFGVFAKTYAKDKKNLTIHLDGSDWTALVYLSLPEHCQGGTTFYEHRDLGLNAVPKDETLLERGFSSKEDFISKQITPISQDLSSWKESVRIKMKFNRLLLFKAGDLFHAADGYFGDTDLNCRLLQLFFFRTGEAL